jgi:cysteine protease ATG4
LNRALANQHKQTNIAVYITGDGSEVYEDGVFKIAKAKTGSFQPTLILVGTRLGLERITPVYWDALKATLQMPQSIGIAG